MFFPTDACETIFLRISSNSFKGVGKFCAGNSLLHDDGINVKLLKISFVRPLNPGKYEVLVGN